MWAGGVELNRNCKFLGTGEVPGNLVDTLTALSVVVEQVNLVTL